MAHFAQINENNIVVQVIVAEQDFINSGAVGDPAKWIQTSYNTLQGQHLLGGTPLRKNYAGIGYTYGVTSPIFTSASPVACGSADSQGHDHVARHRASRWVE